MESAYKLAIEIVANAKNFEVNINKAGGAVDNIVDKTREAAGENSKFAGSFGSVTSGISKFMGIASLAVGSLAFIKSSMMAIEGPGDKFEAVIAGGKTALFEMQRAIATMDFSNFFKNISEGYKRGKEFAELLDALAEEGGYTEYKGAALKVRSAELRAQIQDLKYSDLAAAQKASGERRVIEEELMKLTIGYAQKEHDAIVANWGETNKVLAADAIKAYEVYRDLEDEKKKLLDEEKNKILLLQNSYDKAISDRERQMADEQLTMIKIGLLRKGLTEEEVKAYMVYQKLSAGEKEGLVKLFETETKYSNAKAEAENRFSMIIRENEMLLERQDKKVQKMIEAASAFPVKAPLTPAGYPGLPETPKLPDLRPSTLPTYKEIQLQVAAQEELNAVIEKGELIAARWSMTWQDIAVTVGEGLKNMASSFKSLGDIIKQSSEDGSVSFADAMNIIAGAAAVAITVLQALACANIISKESEKGVLGIITAIAGIAAIIALFASYANPKAMAEGALAYGPTHALVGEYPNAQNDPEVISPLSKLKDIIGGSQQPVPQRMRLMVDDQGSLNAYIEYRQRHIRSFN
jgi:hypothetical protein